MEQTEQVEQFDNEYFNTDRILSISKQKLNDDIAYGLINNSLWKTVFCSTFSKMEQEIVRQKTTFFALISTFFGISKSIS